MTITLLFTDSWTYIIKSHDCTWFWSSWMWALVSLTSNSYSKKINVSKQAMWVQASHTPWTRNSFTSKMRNWVKSLVFSLCFTEVCNFEEDLQRYYRCLSLISFKMCFKPIGTLEWVAIAFSRGSSQLRIFPGLPDPGIDPGSPALQANYHVSHQGLQ